MKSELPQKLILFSLNNQPFGLDVIAVQEILSKVAMRSVPRAAKHIWGIFDFRGKIIPAINLQALLSLQETNTKGNIIVVKHESQVFGLMVDKVLAVLTDQDQVQVLDQGQPDNPYLAGHVTYKEQEVTLLELANLAMTVAKKEEYDVSRDA